MDPLLGFSKAFATEPWETGINLYQSSETILSSSEISEPTGLTSSTSLPVLYTFRRCPYAMRARLALAVSEQNVEVREVVLRDKPEAMLEALPKGTVPVLVTDELILEQSLDIILWSLKQHDPDGWLRFSQEELVTMAELIEECDEEFKDNLDLYKYCDRYPEYSQQHYQIQCLPFLDNLNGRLKSGQYLFADRLSYADIAIFPFIRQFANVDAAWFEDQPYAELQRWLNQLLNSELFKSVMTKYPQWKPGGELVTFARRH